MAGKKRKPIEILMTLVDRVTSPLNRMKGGLSALGQFADKARAKLDAVGGVGRKIAIAGAAILALGLLTGKAFADVESAAAPLRTVIESTMGGVEASMKGAFSEARKWSDNHVQSMQQWLETSYKVAGANLNDVQTIAATNTAMGLATAGLADNADAANVLTDAYLLFGNQNADVGEEMTRLGDRLLVTQQKFKFDNLGVLRESLKMAAPAAKQFGVDLDQTLSVLGALNSRGLAGTLAGTAYAATLRQMSKASKALGFEIARTKNGQIDLIGTLANIRAKYGDLEKASQKVKDKFGKAFGDEGIRMVSLLSGEVGSLATHMERLDQSGGGVATTLKIMEDVPNAKWEIFKNNISNIARDVGQSLAPAFNPLLANLQATTKRLGEFISAHPKITKYVALFILIGGAILLAAGAALMLVAGIGHAVTFVLGGIAAFAKFGQLLWMLSNWGKLLAFVLKSSLVGGLKMLGSAIAVVGKAMMSLLLNPVGLIIVGIVLLGLAIYMVIKHFDAIRAWLSGVPDWVLIAVAAFLPFIGIPALIIKHWDKVKVWFQGAWAWVKVAGSRFIETWVEGVKIAWSKGLTAVKDLFGAIRRLLNFSDAKEGPLSDVSRAGRAFTQTWTAGMRAGKADLVSAASDMLSGPAFVFSQDSEAPPPRDNRGGSYRGGNRIGSVNVTVNGSGEGTEAQVERAMSNVLRRYSYEMG